MVFERVVRGGDLYHTPETGVWYRCDALSTPSTRSNPIPLWRDDRLCDVMFGRVVLARGDACERCLVVAMQGRV